MAFGFERGSVLGVIRWKSNLDPLVPARTGSTRVARVEETSLEGRDLDEGDAGPFTELATRVRADVDVKGDDATV
jgi:hypothetical protein